MDNKSWDCIIVGAGSAGCALAYELVRSGRTVLVIEAGGPDYSPFIKIPAGVIRAGANHDWGYRSQPDPTRNDAIENWTRGRVLGGSSSINGTMYVRGAAADFDRWNVPGWSAKDVMPLFRELENSDQLDPLRGHSGPQYVRTVRQPHATTKAFIESARAAGYRFNQDYNGESQEGVAYAQLSQRRGFRCSAADAFLKPVLGERNIKLLLHALVGKIEIEKGRAVAVSFVYRGKQYREKGRNIILSAGAINSPKLLMLSGIGDAQELSRHKIDVLVDLPAVGRHLKEHPLLTLVYRSKIPTHNLSNGLLQALGFAVKYLRCGEGAISNLFEGVAFVKSSAAEHSPDLQLIFLPHGFATDRAGAFKPTPYPSVAVHILGSYPKSSGRIRLTTNDPNDPPMIECRLLEEQADIDSLVHGVRIVRRIMKTAPISSLIENELAPGTQIESVPALQDFVRNHTGISYHPIGTCRMGVDADAVVGPDLRIHGIENLWIADASIVPHPLSGNMNAACMMIGLRLGKDLIAKSPGGT